MGNLCSQSQIDGFAPTAFAHHSRQSWKKPANQEFAKVQNISGPLDASYLSHYSNIRFDTCEASDQFEANKMKLIWKGQRYGISNSKFCVGNDYKQDDGFDGMIEGEESVQKRVKEEKEEGE